MNTGSSSELPIRHLSSRSSRIIKTGYQRFERPVYDFDAKYAPCRAGCPAGHNIPLAMSLASRGRFDLALQVFREDTPFPAITGRVCYHPCEHACNRGEHDQPLAINALECALAEYGGGATAETAPRQHEESVGIIGAGPAGLACAYHLARMGYPVTVYDANDKPGGALSYGIPPYRLPREVLATEWEALRELGVAFRCGVRIGTDISFAQLRESYHALFIAPGLGRARALPLAVPADPRIQSGLGFLRTVSTGTAHALSGVVAVIGGGDVAIDAARSALRLGAQKVLLCSAEEAAQLPAHPEEVDGAQREGVELHSGVALRQLEAGGHGLRLTLGRVRGLQRESGGQVRLEMEAGEGETLVVSHLIYAIGQEADLAFLPAELTAAGRIPVGAWGETALPSVFAGGDVTGSYNVVNALASAKRAAIGIDVLLRRRQINGLEEQIRVGEDGPISMAAYLAWREGEPLTPAVRQVRLEDINLDYFPVAERTNAREINPAKRTATFIEAHLPLSLAEATAEAKRCFNCGECNMCGNCFTFCPDSSVIQQDEWGFRIDLEHCKGCGVCVEECPRASLSLVPELEVACERQNG